MIPKQFKLRTLLLATTLVAAYGAAYRADIVREQAVANYVNNFISAMDAEKYHDAYAIAIQASEQFPRTYVIQAVVLKANHINSLRDQMHCFDDLPQEWQPPWRCALVDPQYGGAQDDDSPITWEELQTRLENAEHRQGASFSVGFGSYSPEEWQRRIDQWNADSD